MRPPSRPRQRHPRTALAGRQTPRPRGRRPGTSNRSTRQARQVRPERSPQADGDGARHAVTQPTSPAEPPPHGAPGRPSDRTAPEDRYLNRELSWLDFNARVLTLAEDPTTPLLERAKFLAIFASNLDEFYMVRVAG